MLRDACFVAAAGDVALLIQVTAWQCSAQPAFSCRPEGETGRGVSDDVCLELSAARRACFCFVLALGACEVGDTFYRPHRRTPTCGRGPISARR